jgi:hypothetical protein
MSTTVKGWTMLEQIKSGIDSVRAARVRTLSRYRLQLADVPPGLFDYWRRSAHLAFEGIPRDKLFFASALDGLLDFFSCVRSSGKPCGLPSAAADSVWHAWAARSPANLERFCLRHFGRVIPHIEAAAMHAQMEGALATCMVYARRLEKLDPVKPSVPALFALDRKLRMPRGYGYALKNGAVTLQRLNADGVPDGAPRFQGGLEGAQLLAAGLISQQVFDAYYRQPSGGSGGGGSCGSVDSSAGGCDGGGDGGSCGGGCGS